MNTVEDRPLDEGALIARAKRGDVAAYERIVKLHQTIAFRTAWVITGSEADAEEAAQDAFLKAYRALHRFREGAPLRPWLLKIVSNEAHNRRAAASGFGFAPPRSAARVTRSRRPKRRSSTRSGAPSFWRRSRSFARRTPP